MHVTCSGAVYLMLASNRSPAPVLEVITPSLSLQGCQMPEKGEQEQEMNTGSYDKWKQEHKLYFLLSFLLLCHPTTTTPTSE